MNYLRSLAVLIRAELPQSQLPDDVDDLLFDLYAVLCLAVGEQVRAVDVHNAWVAWMLTREPDHPSLQPYSQLDQETAAADQPFVEAIRSVAVNRSIRQPGGAGT